VTPNDFEELDRRSNVTSSVIVPTRSNLNQKHENEYIQNDFDHLNIHTKVPLLEDFAASRKNNNSFPKTNPIITKLINPPNFNLPVDKNTTNYPKLIKTILQHIEFGSAEIDYQKINLATDHIEMALYYLKNIHQ